MKPSERVCVTYDLGNGISRREVDPRGLVAYLDEEAERREALEKVVLERLAKLESHAAQNPIGETEHGDKVYGYEREAAEPEPEPQ